MSSKYSNPVLLKYLLLFVIITCLVTFYIIHNIDKVNKQKIQRPCFVAGSLSSNPSDMSLQKI